MNEALIEQDHVRVKRCRPGVMLYLVNDMYIGRSLDLYGEFSEGEADLFRQVLKPGQVAIEVGANIGAHTVTIAKAVGPSGAVVAYEPQRVVFQALCANLALNALTNVNAVRAAVGNQTDTILVPQLDLQQQGNFGGLALGAWNRGEEVQLVRIDDSEMAACHLLKIDVEGMECDVIEGAEQTIRRHRPALYVENDREEHSAALIERILGLDYRLYWHMPRLFNPNNFFDNSENVFGNIVSANMLCVHKDVPQDVQHLREITSPRDNWRTAGS